MRRTIYAALLCVLVFGCAARPTQPATTRDAFPYPFPVKTFDLTEQGQPLHMAYMDVRPDKPNGETVVLLHGKNFAGYYWQRTATDLAAAGYRVVVPDQLGFGKSSKAPTLQYTFHNLATHTAGLLDALGVERVHVVGHSMGGMLATRFSLMYPGRVATLTLVNPIGLEDWKTVVPYRTIDEWTARELKANYASMKSYQSQSYYAGGWPAGAEQFLLPAAAETTKPDWPEQARVSARLYDMIFTQPVFYEFDRLAVPTTLVIGQRDRTALGKDAVPKNVAATLGDYPALGKAAAARIPGARLVEIKNSGHMPMVEAYDAYYAALLQSFGGPAPAPRGE